MSRLTSKASTDRLAAGQGGPLSPQLPAEQSQPSNATLAPADHPLKPKRSFTDRLGLGEIIIDLSVTHDNR